MLPKCGAAISTVNNLVIVSSLSRFSSLSSQRVYTRCGLRVTPPYPSAGTTPQNYGRRWISSRSHNSSTLSRTERRALERKQRNRERKQHQQPQQQTTDTHPTNTQSGSSELLPQGRFQLLTKVVTQRLQESMYPRVLGSGQHFHKEHLSALLYRLPFALALGYLLTDSDADWSPYTIQPSLGPSMLPTIQFIGDVWLVETGAWSRRLGISATYQHGDVVLWKDANTGRVSCIRIIGLPGDSVQRYGEYAQIYHQDKDSNYGIVWPKHSDMDDVNNNNSTQWDPTPDNTQIDRQYSIPEDHVWLEGDCPPFSLDSRQYGPIPMSWIRGRLLLRLWPWTDDLYLENVPSRQSKWMRNKPRPVPFSSKEHYLGKRFNFYRISKQEPEPKAA